MGTTFYFDWEVSLMNAMQASGNIVIEKLAEFFTMFGEDAVMVFIMGLFFWGFNKRIGKNIGLYFMAGLMTGSLVKNLVMRRRPYMDHETIKCLRPVSSDGPIDDILAQGFSFPSLHANDSMTIYGTILIYAKKNIYRILLGILIVAIGISRVYLGVHYPGDIFFGALWGVFSALVVYYTLLYLLRKNGGQRCFYSSAFTSSGYLRTDLVAVSATFSLTLVYVMIRAVFYASVF